MLTAPQQCSVFLTKHKEILNSCHSCSAQYLFQKDKFYNTRYDTGDKHIQCGRRADVMKFWLMWKAKVSLLLLVQVQVTKSKTIFFWFCWSFAGCLLKNEVTNCKVTLYVKRHLWTIICFRGPAALRITSIECSTFQNILSIKFKTGRISSWY